MTDQTQWGDVIPWTAADRAKGECPVPGNEMVQVFWDDGSTLPVGPACDIFWDDSALIAYRRKVHPAWVTMPGFKLADGDWVFSTETGPNAKYILRFPVGPDGMPCGDPEWVNEGEKE